MPNFDNHSTLCIRWADGRCDTFEFSCYYDVCDYANAAYRAGKCIDFVVVW